MPKLKADPVSLTQDNLSDLQQGASASRFSAQPGHLRTKQFKKKINLRLSPEVLEAFRATGPNWQERMDAALRTALENGWLDNVEK